MKLYEMVKICGEMLNLGLPEEYFTPDGAAAQEDPAVIRLVHACQLVSDMLHSDYSTSLCRARVEAKNGRIDVTDLRLCRVISLMDGSGCNAHYRYAENALLVERDGRYNLCYSQLPTAAVWDGELSMPAPNFTPRVFVYGVLREYCAAAGDFLSAKQWDERYSDAVRVLAVKKTSMRLPTRRWL